MTRRVVVTGLGMVSPLGNDLETSWQAALRGESGVELVTSFDASILGSQIAGTVKNLVWAAHHAEGAADAELAASLEAAVDAAKAEFERQMNDDFNTAGALAAYFQLVTDANTYLDQAGSAVDVDVATGAAASIAGAFKILGIELPEPEEELPVGLLGVAAGLCAYTGDDVAEAAEQILTARAEARAAKNWDVADAIRDQLRDMGLVIEDTAAGSRIKHA